MKYALITDNSVQWFSYLVSIFDTGEVVEYYGLDTGISNDYLNNMFVGGKLVDGFRLTIPGSSIDSFHGIIISEYDFKRIKKLIQLYPSVKEYERLGRLEKI